MRTHAEITSLADAVADLVRDGDSVALEGFTHLIPFAAGHEIVRQGRRDLELMRMTPDLVYDQLIGMGCARKLVFSWGGNPGVGSLHRFRDAVENGWPARWRSRSTRTRGWPTATRPARPAAVRGPARLQRHRRCPSTRTTSSRSRARSPARCSTRCRRCGRTWRSSTRSAPTAQGNVQLWGIPGSRRRRCWRRALARHRRGDRRRARRRGPARRAPALGRHRACRGAARRAARPTRSTTTTATTTSTSAWDAIARDRDTFEAWMEEHVSGAQRRRDDDRGRGPRSCATARSASSASGCRARRANLARGRTRPASCSSTRPGTIGAKPTRLPLSIGDGDLAETADSVVPVPEIFNYWLQGGRIDVGFLGAAQIDRFGNMNSTVIGDYDAAEGPAARRRRRAGDRRVAAAGDHDHAPVPAHVRRASWTSYVRRHGDGRRARAARAARKGPTKVITDLGMLEPDRETASSCSPTCTRA